MSLAEDQQLIYRQVRVVCAPGETESRERWREERKYKREVEERRCGVKARGK